MSRNARPLARALTRPLAPTVAAVLCAFGLAGVSLPAAAHPHVWVDVRNTLLFDADGRVTGVRAEWLFDALFSAFALSEVDTDKDGTASAEELVPLAAGYLDSLREYDYFMEVTSGGAIIDIADATEGLAENRDGRLMLAFTAPLAAPVDGALGDLEVRSYDPTYYVALDMAESEAAALGENAADACRVAVEPPKDGGEWQTLADSALGDGVAVRSVAAQYASVVRLTCAP
ncbi:MAG: DUF1007 family protein [Alphaproteobacteria bacterium]|nr:DUF1007 family protein [Alphaproteobacteria bacterium]MDX5369942.1 DUF1007 family protein [Alphaproteobacteria bacterium]MDX5464517.1 DUF1007 family protein [Alphaproteobacteria bacterium]